MEAAVQGATKALEGVMQTISITHLCMDEYVLPIGVRPELPGRCGFWGEILPPYPLLDSQAPICA
jgi:hypothetical protein